MNVVYNILGAVEDALLEKYFAEIEFENQDKSYQAAIACIIVARNRIDAKDVLAQINTELVNRYKFKVTELTISKKPLSEDDFRKKELALQDSFRGLNNERIGTVTFSTHLGANFIPEDQRPLSSKYFERKLQYNVIKNVVVNNGYTRRAFNIDELFELSIQVKEDNKKPEPKIDFDKKTLDIMRNLNNGDNTKL